MIALMTEQLVRIDGAVLDRSIGRTIKGIAAGRGIPLRKVWDSLGMGRSAWYEKSKGQSQFTASEVARAAVLLNVSVENLYSGMGGLFTPPLPRLDSNQKPAGDWPGDGDLSGQVICFPSRPSGPVVPRREREKIPA